MVTRAADPQTYRPTDRPTDLQTYRQTYSGACEPPYSPTDHLRAHVLRTADLEGLLGGEVEVGDLVGARKAEPVVLKAREGIDQRRPVCR